MGVKSATHFSLFGKSGFYKNEPTAPRDYLASTLHDIHTRPLACYVSERTVSARAVHLGSAIVRALAAGSARATARPPCIDPNPRSPARA